MAKPVGLSRKITLKWLNTAVELLKYNLTEEAYKAKLNAYLSFEIESPIVLRKTREILMRVWFYDYGNDVKTIREDALQLIENNPSCIMSVHWCLLLLAYPVFADLCTLVGHIAKFNDVISLSQLKQKLYDEWGERSTLYHSTDKIIATMKELGAITAIKPGKYSITMQNIENADIVAFMLRVAMRVDGKSYYTFSELPSFGFFYPFEYNVAKEKLIENSDFTVTKIGGELTVALSSR